MVIVIGVVCKQRGLSGEVNINDVLEVYSTFMYSEKLVKKI